MVKKIHVPARQNPIVNRLNKTKEERTPDLRAEKEADLAQKRKADRLKREGMKAQEREEKRRRDQLKWEKEHAYDELMDERNMVCSLTHCRPVGREHSTGRGMHLPRFKSTVDATCWQVILQVSNQDRDANFYDDDFM
jgi:hypothetical protein